MTLLEKAKSHRKPTHKVLGRQSQHELVDRVDLALAYVRGEITLAQAASAIGPSPAQCMASALMTAARNGFIQIKKVEAA